MAYIFFVCFGWFMFHMFPPFERDKLFSDSAMRFFFLIFEKYDSLIKVKTASLKYAPLTQYS